MGSLIAALFGVDAGTFRTAHWPDRAAIAAGSADRFEGIDAAAWLAELVAELELGFAAHACTVREHELAAGARIAERAHDHEAIVLAVHGEIHVGPHVLAPGTALFQPRGGSRELVAVADARVIVFVLRVPTWIEMVASTLLVELARDAAWREPVRDGVMDASDREALEDVVALLAAAPPRTR